MNYLECLLGVIPSDSKSLFEISTFDRERLFLDLEEESSSSLDHPNSTEFFIPSTFHINP
jgi:hypothetical protein